MIYQPGLAGSEKNEDSKGQKDCTTWHAGHLPETARNRSEGFEHDAATSMAELRCNMLSRIVRLTSKDLPFVFLEPMQSFSYGSKGMLYLRHWTASGMFYLKPQWKLGFC